VPPRSTATPSPTITASTTPTPVPSTATAGCAATILASMSEPQRIGQLFMIGLTNDRLDAAERAAIAADHFGSMVFTKKTGEGVQGVRAVADAIQAQATNAATNGVRFFVAANQEGGLIQSLSGPGFDSIPSALSQGAMSTASLRTNATTWGDQLVAAGVDLDLAPVSDVVPAGTDAQNAPIGQLKREYGHDPTTAASHVAAFIAGMHEAGVETSAKHFPGLGRVVGNTDVTSAVVDTVTTRDDPYLKPFARAIDAGVPFVMVSLATYERIDPDHLAVFSPTVIGGMLRGDLGFRGVVVSDSLGATAVKAIPPATRAIDFLDAGGDMIIANRLADAVPMAEGLTSLASTDASFRDRIDDAALRILVAKDAAGLLSCRG
jgi:beta-N-acetylhexosaminidase